MTNETLAGLEVLGFVVLLLAGIPVGFAIAAAGILFGLLGFGHNLFSLVPLQIYGVATNYTLLAVPLFVFMGVLLEKSRIAEEMLDVMGLMAGRIPGGMSIGIIVIGILMGAATGIVGATVVTVSLLSLPTLLKRGYHKGLACGTICASGTLGQIIPPSLILILPLWGARHPRSGAASRPRQVLALSNSRMATPATRTRSTRIVLTAGMSSLNSPFSPCRIR